MIELLVFLFGVAGLVVFVDVRDTPGQLPVGVGLRFLALFIGGLLLSLWGLLNTNNQRRSVSALYIVVGLLLSLGSAGAFLAGVL